MNRLFVGIPTINRPMLVRETINSVLTQTYSELSVVVSDNRSDPRAIESARRYVDGLNDGRIRVIVQPRNDGEYGQGRYFLEQAAGYEYFMILHDDDVLKPSYVETALEALEYDPSVSAFLADPYVFDEHGNYSDKETKKYLTHHGRIGATTGQIDILSKYLLYGFLPISGTVFRRSALQESGFVDQAIVGNFPFECDVFLRLGQAGASAWYLSEELIGFRFHRSSMRNYMNLMENRQVVSRMLHLFTSYRYDGRLERRRRAILSRLHRANALMDIRDGKSSEARSNLVAALRSNALSMKAWAIAPFALLSPRLCSYFLQSTAEAHEAPVYAVHREKLHDRK